MPSVTLGIKFNNKSLTGGYTMLKEKLHKTGRKMDYTDIDKRFIKYLDSQERVEVTWKAGFEDYTGYGSFTDGKKARFYVGRSTGWKPVLLQIYKRNSYGGSAISSSAIKSIRGLGIYR
jgi:hypothetical protein